MRWIGSCHSSPEETDVSTHTLANVPNTVSNECLEQISKAQDVSLISLATIPTFVKGHTQIDFQFQQQASSCFEIGHGVSEKLNIAWALVPCEAKLETPATAVWGAAC